MANHCENVLRVSGAHDELLRFSKTFRAGMRDSEENYHFDNLYPTPKFSVCDRADWRKEHWGIKGNFYEDSFLYDRLRADDMETYYYFDTPWLPPEKLIEHVSENFPEIEFLLIFSEDGNGVGGINKYENGSVISEEELLPEDKDYWFGTDETRKGA